ncbi:MAG: fatty acid desaturase, partial [Novosphingobium sp.]
MVATTFPTSADAHFERLRQAPVLALPTALLFVVSMAGIATTWYLALNAVIPLWVGSIVNGLITYLLFSVIHDASHKSLS